jgi:hypothetical protein
MAGSGEFPKVTGDVIYANDYNTIRNIAVGVVNTFYGNSVSSSAVVQEAQITAAHMDNLRLDIDKAYTHITNGNSGIADKAQGDSITHQDWNAYKTAADYIETNKLTVHPSQEQSFVNNGSITAAWNGQRFYTVRYTWSSAAQADYFFNAGGRFVIDVSADGSTGTSKDNDWQNNILNAIPTQTYTRTNWVNGTNISVTDFGNVTQYVENYCRITATKQNSTTLDITVEINDADVGDKTGTGPAVDENVNTNAYASITRFVSFNAITVENPTATTTATW